MKKVLFMLCVLVAMGSCTGRAARTEAGADEKVAADSVANPTVEHFAGTDITPDGKLPIVIDFNAEWCPPCRMFGPVFHEVAASMQGKARFVSVNVDDYSAVARKFGVTSIPQVTVLKPDGSIVNTTGYMDRPTFEAFLSSALK